MQLQHCSHVWLKGTKGEFIYANKSNESLLEGTFRSPIEPKENNVA